MCSRYFNKTTVRSALSSFRGSPLSLRFFLTGFVFQRWILQPLFSILLSLNSSPQMLGSSPSSQPSSTLCVASHGSDLGLQSQLSEVSSDATYGAINLSDSRSLLSSSGLKDASNGLEADVMFDLTEENDTVWSLDDPRRNLRQRKKGGSSNSE